MLLAFVMIPVLQKELDAFKDSVWNYRRIRAQRNTVLPDGAPNHMYSFPCKYGLEGCGMNNNNLETFLLFITCRK